MFQFSLLMVSSVGMIMLSLTFAFYFGACAINSMSQKDGWDLGRGVVLRYALCALFAAMLAVISAVGLIVDLFGLLDAVADGEVEEVVWSSGLHASDRGGGDGVYIREKDSAYLVVEDVRGDGGVLEASYPVGETVVYGDADAETARVEEVRRFDERSAKWLWLDSGYRRYKETEYRIHVPEGALAEASGVVAYE